MSTQDSRRLFELFQKALRVPLEERATFLQEACADTDELKLVEDLLRADRDNEQSPPKLVMANDQVLEAILANVRDSDGNTPLQGVGHSGAIEGCRLGSYVLQSELGRGGMGVVYLALQESTSQLVALKCLRPVGSTPKMLERFEQEVQVLGKLDHVGIAKVFDAGTFETDTQALHYFAMEYVRGKNLSEYARTRKLDLRERITLLAAICDAVQHAHEKGIVHRDLKPANILVTEDGQPKVLDFGVSRVVDRDQQLTTIGSDGARLIGTLSYMSPEQAGGEQHAVEETSDVYALGVIAYELLCEQLPHDLTDLTLLSAARVVRDETPRRLRAVAVHLPTDVETIVGKALEQEPGRRYASTADMAEDLRRFLRHETILARPPSTFYSVVKFARRHRTLAGSTLTILVVLLIATAASLRWAVRAEDARAAAEWSSYKTTLSLSESDLRQGQHSRAYRSLAEVAEESRGWAWRYLDRRTDQSEFTIDEAHWIVIWSVALSKDGLRAYSCGGDAFVRSWDPATGKMIAETEDHQERTFAVAVAPDGERIASASVDVRIRDAQSLEILATIEGHSGTIHGLCYSPDGTLLASGDMNGTLLLSDSEDGHLVRQLAGHDAFLWELAFSRDGRLLATADGDGVVKVWDVASGAELVKLETDGGYAMGVDSSADGKRLVIGSRDGRLRVASVETGEVLLSCAAHTDQIRDVLCTPDGTRILSASKDRSIGVWDAETLAPIARLTGHTEAVASLALDANGEQLLSTSQDRTIKSWDTAVLRHGNLQYPIPNVLGFAASSEPGVFHTFADDWSVTKHSVHSGIALHTIPPRALAPARYKHIAHGGTILAFGRPKHETDPASTRLYFCDGSEAHLDGQVGDWAGLVLEGRELWLMRLDGTVAFFDPQTGEELRVMDGFVSECKVVAIDRDERWVAAGDDGRFTVRIHDRQSGEELALLDGHSNQIEDLKFDADGRWLLTACDDSTVRIWKTGTWQELAVLGTHGGMDVRACFHPDGTRLASVSSDGIVRLWATETWDEILAVQLPEGAGRATSIDFSPRGDQLFVVMGSGLHVLDAR